MKTAAAGSALFTFTGGDPGQRASGSVEPMRPKKRKSWLLLRGADRIRTDV